ncbi:MAG: ABC transporter ATP-binding protein [Desulfotomaculaceae bacterium]|nr:ABC transporter ATP-binding protein [Desulfotomaculaceae bacterium]
MAAKVPDLRRGAGVGHQRFKITEKPKDIRETLLRLVKIFRVRRRSLFLAALLTVTSTTVNIFAPYLAGQAINTFNISTNTVDVLLLQTILMALVLCYLTRWFIDTFNGVLMARVTQDLVRYIRTEFFSKLQRVPLKFYDNRSHGDTMSRITNDVDNISSTISQTTTQLLAGITSITGSLVMMLILSPFLTLVTMVTIPLFLLLTRSIATNSRQYFAGQQQKLGELNAVIEENIVGLKMVKAFNRQQNVLEAYKSINLDLRNYSIMAQIWAGFMMPIMVLINNLGFALIAVVGGVMSTRGMVTIGVIVSFLTYSKQFNMPLNNIAGMFNNIQSAMAGAERVFEIMDEAEEVPDKAGSIELLYPRGEVEFSHASFSYDTGKPVLKDINFRLQPGEVVALVGGTGSGKTTIVNLLIRYYELDEGKILIDGTDITSISRKSLRNCFSVVLQDTFLYSGTICDNIRYSRPEATDQEVMEAAILAHADEFITRLPNGYDTVVTGSTDNLSQGQRQLLAIARAVLSKAPILILDEATSSVDIKTEKEIQQALLALMEHRTSFLIAHRLSTIRDADKIMVIGDGEILESGTHMELMERKGAYYQMVRSQMGFEGGESVYELNLPVCEGDK